MQLSSYPSFNTRHSKMINISCCLPGCLLVHVGCSKERQQTGGRGFRRQCAQMKDSGCLSSPEHKASLEKASNTDLFRVFICGPQSACKGGEFPHLHMCGSAQHHTSEAQPAMDPVLPQAARLRRSYLTTGELSFWLGTNTSTSG